MTIRCLIFDCDGTLVDSEHLSMMAFVCALESLGVNLSADACIERYRGWQLAAMIADVESGCGLKTGADFILTYRSLERSLLTRELRPIHGVETMLHQLTLPKCVASSAPQAKIRHSLALTGLAAHFGANLFSAYDINSWKPAPDLFLHAARQMGFAPAECAVIEDSYVGVTAGLAAGMRVFQYAPGDWEIHAGAIAIKSMAELPAQIEKIRGEMNVETQDSINRSARSGRNCIASQCAIIPYCH